MRKQILILLIFISGTILVKGQTLFEDTKGESSVNLPSGGKVMINTADANLKCSYFYSDINDTDKFVRTVGIDLMGKSNDGFAQIFSGTKISPSASIKLNFGIMSLLFPRESSNYDYLNIAVGYRGAKYKLYNPINSFENQITKENFSGLSFDIGYNILITGNFLFAASFGYYQSNNISSLDQLEITEETSYNDSTLHTKRTTTNKYSVWEGEYKKENFYNLKTDFIYFPEFLNHRFGLSLHTRTNLNQDNTPINAGFGVYFLKEGDPTKVYGGLIYDFDDIFDFQKAKTNLVSRGNFGIVLGYNF